MAGAETPLGAWQSQIPGVRQPQVNWRGGKSWGLFAVALAFVALGFLVPQSIASLGASRLDVTREVERLKDQLDVLDKEKIVEAEKAEALKVDARSAETRRLGQGPGQDASRRWITSRSRSRRPPRRPPRRPTARWKRWAAPRRWPTRCRRTATSSTAEQMKEALNQMAALMRKAAEENELLERRSRPRNAEGDQGEQADAKEMLKKIADALKDGKKGRRSKVAKLVKAKLIDADALKKCRQGRQVRLRRAGGVPEGERHQRRGRRQTAGGRGRATAASTAALARPS